MLKPWSRVALVAVPMLMLGGIVAYADNEHTADKPSAAPALTTTFDESKLPRISDPDTWRYFGEDDEIRKGTVQYAMVGSLNESTTADGETTQLVIRLARSPDGSAAAIFYFNPGKFGCSEPVCVLQASFDGQRDTVLVRALPEYDMLSLYDPSGFARRLSRTKRFVVEVGMLGQGTEQFSFNTMGLVDSFIPPEAQTSSAVPMEIPVSESAELPGGNVWTPGMTPTSSTELAASAPTSDTGDRGSLAQPPKPLGRLGQWVDATTYPPSALRAKIQGTTGFRLNIGTDGRVKNCMILQTSGSADLDDATCKRITQRGQFEPAKNADGEPVEGFVAYKAVWSLH